MIRQASFNTVVTRRGAPMLGYAARGLTEEQRGRLGLGPARVLTRSMASDEDFRGPVVELRQIPLPRGADSVSPS